MEILRSLLETGTCELSETANDSGCSCLHRIVGAHAEGGDRLCGSTRQHRHAAQSHCADTQFRRQPEKPEMWLWTRKMHSFCEARSARNSHALGCFPFCSM